MTFKAHSAKKCACCLYCPPMTMLWRKLCNYCFLHNCSIICIVSTPRKLCKRMTFSHQKNLPFGTTTSRKTLSYLLTLFPSQIVVLFALHKSWTISQSLGKRYRNIISSAIMRSPNGYTKNLFCMCSAFCNLRGFIAISSILYEPHNSKHLIPCWHTLSTNFWEVVCSPVYCAPVLPLFAQRQQLRRGAELRIAHEVSANILAQDKRA